MSDAFAERERVFALFSEGNRAFEEGRYEESKRAGEALIASHFSGGFELVARSHAALGAVAAAVETLEAGVKIAPGVWVLWKLLGDFRSDSGSLDAALEAYQRAVECEQCDVALVRFNRGIALDRAGRHDEALAAIDGLAEDRSLPFRAHVLALRAGILRAKGELDAAREMLESALEEQIEDSQAFAMVCFELAQIELALGTDPQAVRPLVLQGLHASATRQGLDVLRALDARSTEGNDHWRVTVAGVIEERGYLRVFDVIAADRAQAFELAVEILPDELRASAAEDEGERVGAMPGVSAGVVYASGFVFYGLDDGDEEGEPTTE